MKKALKPAFLATLPVMTGYLVLGFGFGLIVLDAKFDVLTALAMSVFIYAGSMQYVAVGMLAAPQLWTIALTTLMVNARHLFYGISMLDKYRGMGKIKAYLIFALTDETYSLVCQDQLPVPEENRRAYYLLVSLLDHLYWITGSVLGAAAGAVLRISTEGVEFALTALFVTVFVEQWLTAKDHRPALIGAGASVLSLVLFGGEHFLIPAMLLIALALCLYTARRKEAAHE